MQNTSRSIALEGKNISILGCMAPYVQRNSNDFRRLWDCKINHIYRDINTGWMTMVPWAQNCWNKGNWGWFSLLIILPVTSNWSHYNPSRSCHINIAAQYDRQMMSPRSLMVRASEQEWSIWQHNCQSLSRLDCLFDLRARKLCLLLKSVKFSSWEVSTSSSLESIKSYFFIFYDFCHREKTHEKQIYIYICIR